MEDAVVGTLLNLQVLQVRKKWRIAAAGVEMCLKNIKVFEIYMSLLYFDVIPIF